MKWNEFKEGELRNLWVAPDGNFIHINQMSHNDQAYGIMYGLKLEMSKGHVFVMIQESRMAAYSYLIAKEGWVMIREWGSGKKQVIHTKPMTREQKRIVKQYAPKFEVIQSNHP